MGLGMELPLLLELGFVVLGPKRMHATLRHVAKRSRRLLQHSGTTGNDRSVASIRGRARFTKMNFSAKKYAPKFLIDKGLS